MGKPEIHTSSINKVIIGEEVNKYIEEVVMNRVNSSLNKLRTEVYSDIRLSVERATSHHIPLYSLILKNFGSIFGNWTVPSITNNPLGPNYIGILFRPDNTIYGLVIEVPSFEIKAFKPLTSGNYWEARTSYRLLTYADPWKSFAITVKSGPNNEYLLCRFSLPSLDEEYCVELTNIQEVYTSNITRDGNYVLIQGRRGDGTPFAEIRKTFNFDVISSISLNRLVVGGDISSNYVCLQSDYDTLTLYDLNFNVIKSISYSGEYYEALIRINEHYGRVGVWARYTEEYTLPDLNLIRRYHRWYFDTSIYSHLYIEFPGQILYSPDGRFLFVLEGEIEHKYFGTLVIDLKTGKFIQLSNVCGYIGDVSNEYIVIGSDYYILVFKYRHLFPPV